jgi:hypothetical protein
MNPSDVLIAYGAQGQIRRRMLQVGFTVERRTAGKAENIAVAKKYVKICFFANNMLFLGCSFECCRE